MIDILNLGSENLTFDDFEFRVGNNDDPQTWVEAPAPIEPIEVDPSQAIGSPDRVTITWPDREIRNQWLQVTVRATANTGLESDDVFYFGNAVGETGDQASEGGVGVSDMIAIRQNATTVGEMAAIDNVFDVNRDGDVGLIDQLEARDNGPLVPLSFITVPDVSLSGAPAVNREVATDVASRLPTIDGGPFWVTVSRRSVLASSWSRSVVSRPDRMQDERVSDRDVLAMTAEVKVAGSLYHH